jgi:hypothetical protein
MRDLGVETVLLGIESGNDSILARNGKPVTSKNILKAVSLLGSNGIKVADAYVLGMIGETRATVQDTVELSDAVRSRCDTEISYWNILTPLPGSRVWETLCSTEHEFRATVRHCGYHLCTDALERMSVTALCDLGPGGYDYLREIRTAMGAQAAIRSFEFVPLTPAYPMTRSVPIE